MVGTADGYRREAERAQAERAQAERAQAERPEADRAEAERLREFIVLKKEARRPQLPVIMWRWRYEIAALLLIPALLIFLLMILGPWWTVADIIVAAVFLVVCPPARGFMAERTRCVVTAHRVRTGCAEAYLVSRHGTLPFIYSTTPAPFGERVKLRCPAGVSAADFESAADILAAACWASDVRVVRDPAHSHLITLEVIRCGPWSRG